MAQTITIKLSRPIKSVKLLDGFARGTGSDARNEKAANEESKKNIANVLSSLKRAVEEINRLQEELFKGHKEQIAKLSVAIAQKILAAKIEKGDYEIESIVQEALENTATRRDVTVHLNPQDMTQMQKAIEDKTSEEPEGVRFVADASIGRAECMIETPSGIVEATIGKHLERICEALKRAG